jgi:hypothetical protein
MKIEKGTKMAKKPLTGMAKLRGNCDNCSRPLHRKTGHIHYNANIDDYEAICKFCLLENPTYGRKKVTQTN